MRFVVTRPQEDAEALAGRLHALGHEAVVEPVLEIRFAERVPLARSGYQAVVATSANGLRGLAACGLADGLLETPVLAVGDASAALARELGFADVRSASGDLPALEALVRDELTADAGPLLYPTGTVVSGDLKGRLEAAGYLVERVELYEAVARTTLSDELEQALRAGTVDGVLLFSPRAARIWAQIAGDAAARGTMACVVHYCLSEAVAEALTGTWRGDPPPLRCADEPTLAHLLARLGQ